MSEQVDKKRSTREIIGSRIRRILKRHGIGPQEAGKRCDKDRQYMWKLMNGNKNITPDKLDEILAGLGVTAEKFNKMSVKPATNKKNK